MSRRRTRSMRSRASRPQCNLEDVGTDDERVVVDGLDELLTAGAEAGMLFSDLAEAPPWAAAAEPFDLAGYESFPRRFAPDAP